MDCNIALENIDETIVAMDVWHLVIPVNSRRDHGIGTIADSIEVIIVKLTSESGKTGYGEASPWSVFTGTPEASFAALNRYFRPLATGSRVGDIACIMNAAERLVVNCTEAKAALETALLDLSGNILGEPIWKLLGDKCRNEIPLSVSLANPEFDDDLELVERLQDDMIGIVKIKTGFKDHAFDLMRMKRLRKLYPDLDIRVDYNQGLDSREAITCVREIDQLEPSFIEQPVIAHDYETMAELRKITNSPLLADESVFGPEDLKRAVREEICDGVSVKIMKSGGIARGMMVSQMAANSNLPAYGGDMFESGIAHLAGVHMIAVSPNVTLGCEFYHATYHLSQDLLAEKFPIQAGKVQVPDAPGLGISVNPDAIEKYAIFHSASGPSQ